jgi:hypothetical protein
VERQGRPVVVKRFALLALVAAFVVGACGGDDDDTDAEGGATDTTAQGEGENDDQTGDSETGQTGASDGEAYPEQFRRNFMTACAAQAGATESQCQCTFDEITRSVAVEEFVAYDQAIQQDPATPPPSWLEAAVVACS